MEGWILIFTSYIMYMNMLKKGESLRKILLIVKNERKDWYKGRDSG